VRGNRGVIQHLNVDWDRQVRLIAASLRAQKSVTSLGEHIASGRSLPTRSSASVTVNQQIMVWQDHPLHSSTRGAPTESGMAMTGGGLPWLGRNDPYIVGDAPL